MQMCKDVEKRKEASKLHSVEQSFYPGSLSYSDTHRQLYIQLIRFLFETPLHTPLNWDTKVGFITLVFTSVSSLKSFKFPP